MNEIISWLINTVGSFGYAGILIMMAIESSVLPLPSELVMIPAGYIAQQGGMNLYIVILLGALGRLFGAGLNYYVSAYLGRPLILKYGRYFFLPEKKFLKVESFFKAHGEITTFIGRLIPGFRHIVSVPAGVVRMNIAKFSAYTLLGAGIWVSILAILGYWIGEEQELLKKYSHNISIALIMASAAIIAVYIFLHRRRKKILKSY